MATLAVPDDFKEFLKLLNAGRVRYLLVGGYAVNLHGYSRSTMDMDIWVAVSRINASRLVAALTAFGFGQPSLSADLFLKEDRVIRMGHPPLRLELLTSIDGVRFSECYARRKRIILDGLPINLISLRDLKQNKRASGRPRDLDDLEHLP
jgi:hypothetical protein